MEALAASNEVALALPSSSGISNEHNPSNQDQTTAIAILATSTDKYSNQQIPRDVLELWKQICPTLTTQQQNDFAALACSGRKLEDYMAALAAECQDIHDNSLATKILPFLEPLYVFAGIVGPVVNLAAQASGVTLPTDVVVGGIRSVLNITRKVPELQKRAIALLARMGSKVRIL
ncbi:MAG: hypothetical protein GOMPHAMPRED_004287 [Gomphillus americanus]|uniref:Uncharacterized protein n=1 Tax=Gomphillus americanus TaxID=1940652 RepID=A0A8H3IGC0_9LECA|nr:MAG: hypothetical protein GOMPHAMPRED_004287 [Gomphillus americanus]